MLGEWKNVPDRTNWTYPEEKAMRQADHPAPSQRLMGPSKREQFSMVREQFEKEFAEFKLFLEEEGVSKKSYFTRYGKSLFYIDFPELFEADISAIDFCGGGELSSADMAWIKNARELAKKYSAICLAERRKISPEMAEGEK